MSTIISIDVIFNTTRRLVRSGVSLSFVFAIFSSAISVGFGFDMANLYTRSGPGNHQILDVCINCRIIRSGSNGILFTNGTESIFYKKWNDIREINIDLY
jgi:hypothetical protein